MTKKLKRPIAFIATLAMVCSMLLYLPGGVMTDLGFGLAVSAEDSTGEPPADTGTTDGTGNTPADTDNTDGTGDPTADTNSTPDSTDEGAAVESEPVMLLAASAATAITPSQPSGDGSVGSPYQIGTAAELYWFAAQVNSGNTTINAVLKADITVNTGVLKADGYWTGSEDYTSWTPIGNSSNQYTGTFNGNDHTVSGLFFYNTSTTYVGLFGYIGNGGRVSNVGVVGSGLYGAEYVGGISGCNYGTIESCYNAGYVNAKGTPSYVGGVCGKNYGTIKNCYNRGNVKLYGVCGENYGTLENCYNAGNLLGTDNSLKRGVCGKTSSGDKIINCYFLNTSVSDVNAIGKSAEEFASGEVAYLLQGKQETNVWGQNIDNGAEIQAYPVLGGAKVYHGYAENDPSALIYSNSELNEDTHVHSYENGFCKVCSNYDAAAKNNSGVYEISNAGQLYWFAQQVNSGNDEIKAILTQDITVNNGDVAGCKGTKAENWKEWTPIGNDSSKYLGTFEGHGYTISGLYFNNPQASYVGLFGCIGATGSVSDVGVINSYINGNEKVGGVCGNNDGTITSCYNTGTVSGTGYTGGVCGHNNYGTIKSCYNTGAVSGTGTYIGGVCGENYGTIENSYNTGAVSSKASYVGGVCGHNRGNEYIIKNCYNTGAVSGNNYVGGVSGQNIDNIIKNCYNTGAVSGSKHVGGVCGDNVIGTIVNCYNTGAVSGNEKVGGVCGSLGGTIANCYFDSTAYSGIAVGTIIDGVVFDNVLGKATAKFTGGEVAYLLWQGCTVNEVTYDGSVWGQTIGTDLSPVFSGAKVYPCTEGCLAKYANTEGATGEHTAPDTYDNGFGKCTDCNVDLYQPATLNNGVYEIGNAGQLYWFAQQVNGGNTGINAILTKDITVNENVLNASGELNSGTFKDWTPIGYKKSNKDKSLYTGTFDGQNNTVSGLYFDDTNTMCVGLFGYISGTVKNVGVVDSYFSGQEVVGGVCGCNNGTIENCYNTGKVSGTTDQVSGVCGRNNGTIENCYNAGVVSGTKYVSGVCGCNTGTIKNCYNTGEVSGSENVGGVCGLYNTGTGTITNCYNTGEVSGSENVGGVCGNNYGHTIENCYNTGKVSGTTKQVGGVCGYNYCGTIKNCYNTGEVSGSENVGGVCGQNYDGPITNCYNTGTVSGSRYVGGVCGYNNHATIQNCYNTGTVSGTGSYVGGVCGRNYSSSSTISNCYYLNTTATGGIGTNNGTSDKVESKTTGEFGSGEVAYLLQSGQTAGENGKIPEVWGQKLTGDNKQGFPVLGGAKVYQTLGCVGYSNTANETKTHNDGNGDEICDVCGGYMDGIGAKLIGYTLSLNGNIGVNFYMELSEEIKASETDYMQFTLPNGDVTTVKVAEVTPKAINTKTYYVFPCEVSSFEMTKPIKAQMFDVNGNSGTENRYTVRDYGEYIINHPDSYEEKDVTFAKALLNYGAYSQAYFKVAVDDLANTSLDEAEKNVDEVTADSLASYKAVSVSNAFGTFAGYSLTLKSETTLKVYFEPAADVDVSSLTFTAAGQTVTPVESGQYYVLSVENIKAWNLDTPYDFSASNGSETLNFSCSAMSYAYSVLLHSESYDSTLVKLISALRIYQQKAEVYGN